MLLTNGDIATSNTIFLLMNLLYFLDTEQQSQNIERCFEQKW